MLVYVLLTYRHLFAKTENNLRSTFHIKHLPALQGYRLCYGCHILALRRERHLRNSLYALTHTTIVHALLVQPEKQSAFRRIAENLRLALVREVDGSRRVNGNALIQHLLRRIAIHLHFVHAHQILRQRSRLVRADNGGGSHRLTGMHLSYKVVGLEHAAHAVSQAQGNGHRQSLRHSHHHQRHGNHQCLKNVCYERRHLFH